MIGYDEAGMTYIVGEMSFANHRGALDHLLAQKKQDTQYQQPGSGSRNVYNR